MKSRKFHYYLNSLSSKEIEGFQHWLACPLHNSKPLYAKLFDYYLANVYQISSDVSSEAFFRGFWQDAAYNDKYLRRVMALLLKCLLEYLAFLGYAQNPLDKDSYLLEELNQRRCTKYFENTYKKVRKAEKSLAWQGDDHFRRNYVHEKEWINYSLITEKAKHQTLYQSALEQADHWYWFTKLKYTCAAINRAKILKQQHQQPLPPAMISHLRANEAHLPVLILLYLNSYLILTEENGTQPFFTLKSLLLEHAEKLAPEEAKVIYIFIFNHFRREIKKGHPYQPELLALYRHQLEKGLLLIKGKLPLLHYKNFTLENLKLGAFDEAVQFLATYRNKLQYDPEGHSYLLGQAYVKFYLQEYTACKALLLQYLPLAPNNVFLQVSARKLLCQAWFELAQADPDSYDLAEREILAFISFAGRKDFLAPKKRAQALEFGRLLNKLFRLMGASQKQKTNQATALAKELSTYSNHEDIYWLEQKLITLS